jgi:two-component system, LytTR family, response regulator
MSERLRAVVVDDEEPARDGLSADLVALGVDVIAACGDARAALAALRTRDADVVFVDVQMPEIDGFALIESLEPEELPPAIVFVTAYDEHAIRAFGVRALDYVLKPFARERLAETVARVRRRVDEARALAAKLDGVGPAPAIGDEPRDARYLTRFVIRERDGSVVVPVDDVEWIEADTYYVRLHLSNGKSRLMRERMAVLEARLDPAAFFRAHRSAIVRLERVRSLKTLSRYEHTVTLASGARVPLSRERRAKLAALLGSDLVVVPSRPA